MNNPLSLLVVGRSGCGKGTQVKRLIEHYNIEISISSGNLLRTLGEVDSIAGRHIKETLESGGLPDAWIVAYLWQKELVERLKTKNDRVILDGLCRRLEEAKTMVSVLEWFGRPLTMLLIDVSREESRRRLIGRNRKDDTEESIEKRLDWFDENVMPAIKYLQDHSRVVTVNGMQSQDEVFREIVRKL